MFDKVELVNYSVLLSYPNTSNPNSLQLFDGKGQLLYNAHSKQEPPLTPGEDDPNVAPPFNAYSGNGTASVSDFCVLVYKVYAACIGEYHYTFMYLCYCVCVRACVCAQKCAHLHIQYVLLCQCHLCSLTLLSKGPLVYVNYGRIKDFLFLTNNLSLDLTGHICIARYGEIFRGDKVSFWQLRMYVLNTLSRLSVPVVLGVQWNLSIPDTLGTKKKVSSMKRCPYFRG